MRRGRGRRVDANHEQIVDAFRRFGWSVQSLAEIGDGCPDLLVARNDCNLVVEIKGPNGLVTTDQVRWAAGWRGRYALVRTIADVEALTREFAHNAGIRDA